MHSERGPESLGHLIRLMAAHDLVHRRQIERILRRVGRPGVSVTADVRVPPRGHRRAPLAPARSPCPTAPSQTPAFMPVGTHGVVRGLSAGDVRRTGAQIILGNTYHLHLRPGEAVVRAMGGLHRFTTWARPDAHRLRRLPGVLARGAPHASTRTASSSRATSTAPTARSRPSAPWRSSGPSGADIAMAFDHVVPGQAPHELACEGMERTLRWLDRCQARHGALTADVATGDGDAGTDRRPPTSVVRQTLWPIIQGGTHDDLRLPLARGHARARAVDRRSPSAGSRWASPSR